MKKTLLIILVVIFVFSSLQGSVEVLKELIGKTVKVSIGGGEYRIGVVTGVDNQKIYIKKSKEKWVKKIIRSDRDAYTGTVRWSKKAIWLIEDAKRIFLLEEGKPDFLFWEELDMDLQELITDPNQDLRVDRSAAKKFKTRPVGVLKKRKSWIRTKKGNWISGESLVTRESDAFNGLIYADDYFHFLKLKEVKYNDKPWLYLWRKSTAANVGNSISIRSLRTGDIVYTVELERSRGGGGNHIFWVFSKEDLERQLKNVKDGQPNLITLKVKTVQLTGANVRAYWEEHPELFEKPIDDPGMLYINLRPFKERNIVQYLVFPWPPVERKPSGKITKRLIEPTKEELVKLFEMVTTEKLFDTGYFESSYQEFNGLFKIDYSR